MKDIKTSDTRSNNIDTTGEQKAKRKYTKPEVRFVPLKVEERLMACLKTGEELNCAANPRDS
ncbi:MAG: hypothetical protein WC139_09620 [Candidatus Kapaibacterium sp.]